MSDSIQQPWMEVDIGYVTAVSGLLTQGDGGSSAADWITKLKVLTYVPSQSGVYIRNADGSIKVILSKFKETNRIKTKRETRKKGKRIEGMWSGKTKTEDSGITTYDRN